MGVSGVYGRVHTDLLHFMVQACVAASVCGHLWYCSDL